MDQETVHSFVGHEAVWRFFDELRGSDVYFVGHNAISFDGPVTSKLVQGFADTSNIVDTLVLSYLYDPALVGGHSLEAWGDRLGDPKGDFSDWSGYSPEMDSYCQQDVKLGKKVTRALWARMRRMGFSEKSCEIEHEIRVVVNEQQRNGWYFDIPGAQSLVSQLRFEQAALEGPILDLFPPRLEVQGTYIRRTTKGGEDFASYDKHVAKYPELRDNGDGTYSTLDWESFNLGSPKQRVARLLELGWEPQNFTEKGFPKVDEEALVSFAETSGRPEAQALADWLVLQGRASMVDGWLNNVNYDDHCMHGFILTCGATTRRMIHNSPNTANIPKAKKKVKYGIECRAGLNCVALLSILQMMKPPFSSQQATHISLTLETSISQMKCVISPSKTVSTAISMVVEMENSGSRLGLSFEGTTLEDMANGLVNALKKVHPDLLSLQVLFKMSFEEMADYCAPLMGDLSGAIPKTLVSTINYKAPVRS